MVIDELFLQRVPTVVDNFVHVAPALAGDGPHAVEAPPGGILAEAGDATVSLVGFRQVSAPVGILGSAAA